MKKHRRYQLTDSQLVPVIRHINENVEDYAVDVNDTGNEYVAIYSVTYDPDKDDLYFSAETQDGQTKTKKIAGNKLHNFNQAVEKELSTFNVPAGVLWEILSATIKNHKLHMIIVADQQDYEVDIPVDYVLGWL
jgi:hypothetical protein